MEKNKIKCSTWGIKRDKKGRFIIIDVITGEVLEDAQGYGFSNYGCAYRYGYNKYHCKGMCLCDGQPNIDEFNKLF